MFRRSRPPRGQHFLHDRHILERIARSLPLSPDRKVIEIGPGEGALTDFLLASGAAVTAIEIDLALVEHLRVKFPASIDSAQLEIIPSDVLSVDLGSVIRERSNGPALVAGNLPYYITSPILRKIFDAAEYVEQAVLLMQREVADRVVAQKDSRDYGFLSVLCHLYAEPKYLFTVSPGAFRPPPKVTSAVVRLTMRKDRSVDPAFLEFLKACFSQPRKKLLNNLSAKYDRADLARYEESQLRAQQMSPLELEKFWRAVEGV